MMVLPPPETTVTNQSPEAFIALVTLFSIAIAVYSLSKIKFSSLKKVYRLLLGQSFPQTIEMIPKGENRHS